MPRTRRLTNAPRGTNAARISTARAPPSHFIIQVLFHLYTRRGLSRHLADTNKKAHYLITFY